MHWGQSTLFFGVILVVMGVFQYLTKRAWANRVPATLRAMGLRKPGDRGPEFWVKLAVPLIVLFWVVGGVFILASLPSLP